MHVERLQHVKLQVMDDLKVTKSRNKPSPAKVGSNKFRVHIGFDLNRIRQTQLRADQA